MQSEVALAKLAEARISVAIIIGNDIKEARGAMVS